MEKEHFGYDQRIIRYLQEVEKSIPVGSFQIMRKGDKGYWCFSHSTGKNRLVHLCSVFDKGGENSSFLNAIKVLKKKLKDVPAANRGKSLIKVIDDCTQQLRKEGVSNRRGTCSTHTPTVTGI